MTATVTNPIWVLKTRLQLEKRHRTVVVGPSSSSPLPGPIAKSAAALAQQSTATAAPATPGVAPAWTMLKEILKKEGVPGLYRGLSASYLGVSEGVIQWVLYEVSNSVHCD